MSGLAVFASVLVLLAVAAMWAALAGWRRSLDGRFAASDAELRRLADAATWREGGTQDIRRELAAFRESLDQMGAREEERRVREDDGWAALQRVSSVLVGGQRAGRTGENVLREALAALPPSMVVTDFQVNGRVVEFGLVLPDGRRLPVDSKWTSDRELRALADAEDPVDRDRLCRLVEHAVAVRAREVSKYLDPSVTAPLAVAAVPDAAYAVLRKAHAEAYRAGVVVISYSLALPFLLFAYQVVARLGGAVDAQACLADLSAVLAAVEVTLENKVERASTILSNGAQELRGHLGKARSAIAGAVPARAAPVAAPVSAPATVLAPMAMPEREPVHPGMLVIEPEPGEPRLVG